MRECKINPDLDFLPQPLTQFHKIFEIAQFKSNFKIFVASLFCNMVWYIGFEILNFKISEVESNLDISKIL